MKWLCQILEVSRSGFYRWLSATPAWAERARADEELVTRIRAIHDDFDGTLRNAPGSTGTLPAPAASRLRAMTMDLA